MLVLLRVPLYRQPHDIEPRRDQLPLGIAPIPDLVLVATIAFGRVVDEADQLATQIVDGDLDRTGDVHREQRVTQSGHIVDLIPVGGKDRGRDLYLVYQANSAQY